MHKLTNHVALPGAEMIFGMSPTLVARTEGGLRLPCLPPDNNQNATRKRLSQSSFLKLQYQFYQ